MNLTRVRNIWCETLHDHRCRVPYECAEFIRPADGCSWGDCTRPAAGRAGGRLMCDRCTRVARICGLA